MPTLAEFILTIGTRREKGEGQLQTIFQFETLREFRSFRYEVDVDGVVNEQKKELLFTLKGVTAPAMLMTSAGSAVRELSYAGLQGEYRVTVKGAKNVGSFRIAISSSGTTLLDAIDLDFVQVRLRDGVETTGE